MARSIKPVSQPTFRRCALALCVMAASQPLLAQTNANEQVPSEQLEEIVVQGVRTSLQNAQDMKRDADTFVDAISASDINALPDKSVLEALQRVPGVAISRFAAADDPDHFATEGSGVVIRGMTQVRSEFNGRDAFSASAGRGLSFEDVPPELMGSVEVFKNQSADMIEGGISGVVNLNTRKPFDSADRQIAFQAAANYADLAEETTPSYSGLFSDRWSTDVGEFGFLISGSYSNLAAISDGIQVEPYVERTDLVAGETVYVPRGVNIRRQEHDRERSGIASAFQWENVDQTALATLQFTRSDATTAWVEHSYEAQDKDLANQAGSGGGFYPADGTQFEYDNNGYFSSGVIASSQAGWRSNDPRIPADQLIGSRYVTLTRDKNQNREVNDFGANLVLNPNEKWEFEFDFQYVDANTDEKDISAHAANYSLTALDLTGSVPHVAYLAASGDPADTHLADPASYFWRSAMDHLEDSEGREIAFKADLAYQIDEGWFKSVKTGVRYSDRDQTTRWTKYNWGSVSEAWTGGGPQWFDGWDGSNVGAPNLPQFVESFGFSNFQRGGVVDIPGGSMLFPSVGLVQDYRNLQNNLAPVNNGDWVAAGNRANAMPGSDYLFSEVNETSEENTAVYVRLDFGNDDLDVPINGNIGVRYVNVVNSAVGFYNFPDFQLDSDPTNINNFLPAEDQAFGNAAGIDATSDGGYSKVLPSLNIKAGFTDELIGRFAVSKAISHPDLGHLRNFLSVSPETILAEVDNSGQIISASIPRYTGSAGNPKLEPMEALQYDMSLEWYFADVGSLTGTLFYKDIENFFVSGAFTQPVTNTTSNVTMPVDVDGPTNGGNATVKGFEIAYQQSFDMLPGWWSGFGIQANYSYIDNQGAPNANLRPVDPESPTQDVIFDDLPLQGLSRDNYNLVGFYENDTVQARLAYSWRSEYLLTTKDVITELPTYEDARGQLDGSLFFNINEQFKVGLEASNLLDTPTTLTTQTNAEGARVDRAWWVNDRRLSLVLRANF